MLLEDNCSHIEQTLKITIPEELKTIWINERFNEQAPSFYFYGFGIARLLMAFDVLHRELSDLGYYDPHPYRIVNKLYNKLKDDSINEKEHDLLNKRLNEDPLVWSMELTRDINLLFPHLNIRTCVAFAKVNRHAHLFYGYDAGGKVLGVYLWELEGDFGATMEMPLFIDFSIKGIIPNYRNFPEGETERFDGDSYIKERLYEEDFINIGSSNDEVLTNMLQFYKNYVELQSVGTSMIFSVSKKIATIKITNRFERSFLLLINFNENDIFINVENINKQLNYHLNDMPRKRPDNRGFYLVRGGLLCYLHIETAMDFAQKGLLRICYSSLPYDAYAPH